MNPRKTLSAILLSLGAITLSACSEPDPIYETVWVRVPEAPHPLKKPPTRKKSFRERLYDGIRSGNLEDETYLTTDKIGHPPSTNPSAQ